MLERSGSTRLMQKSGTGSAFGSRLSAARMSALIKPRRRRRHLFAALFVLSVTAPFSAVALDPDIPNGCGPLPDLTKGANVGALVSGEQSREYRAVLPPEIMQLVDRGEFQFEGVLRPRDGERIAAMTSSTAGGYMLGSGGDLRSFPATGLGARPFGVPSSIEGDPTSFAYKVLWNSAGALAELRASSVTISAHIFPKSDGEPHVLEFLDERIYPLSLGLPIGSQKPLFREKISATKPEVIKNLSWLTLRFLGASEDYLWAASPVINKIRQMTGSNRSDAMFSQSFAPDDLFVWSGKIELVEPVSISAQPILVPVLQGAEATSVDNGECVEHHFRDGSGLVLNSDSKRFKGAGGWVPSNVVMALRNTWRVELTSKDPFSNDSRQIVYFDRESGVPVYRIVWDQSERLRKVVGGVLRSLQVTPNTWAGVWAGEFIIPSNEASRVVLIAQELKVCKSAGPSRGLEEFDPSSFMKFDSKQPVVEAKEKSLERARESDDISD